VSAPICTIGALFFRVAEMERVHRGSSRSMPDASRRWAVWQTAQIKSGNAIELLGLR
jgi:hypothetical protein